jgi:hypothetical protein
VIDVSTKKFVEAGFVRGIKRNEDYTTCYIKFRVCTSSGNHCGLSPRLVLAFTVYEKVLLQALHVHAAEQL